MDYCIIKFQKIKSNSELSEYAGHNLRTKISKTRNENIDQDRTSHNQLVKNTFNVIKPADLQKSINAHFDKLGIKVKKDNVLAIDLIATTSPEFWGDWQNKIGTPEFEKIKKAWVAVQLKQAEDEYGAENVVFADLHLDESTPHLHILILPIESKEVTYKNRHGSTTKTKSILNANKYNPEFYTGLVTRFAEANSVFGLRRGNFNAMVDPKPLKDYKNELKKEIQKQKKITDSYVRAITGAQGQVQLIKTLTAENYALKRENNLMRAKDAQQKGIPLDDKTIDLLGL